MFQHFFEWFMSKSDPRFKSYREARLIYEAYIHDRRIQFESLTYEQCKEASEDVRLQKAEQLYRQAIDLSQRANVLEDVATGLYQLGMLLHLQGKISEAERPFRESIGILEELPKTDRSKQAAISGCYYHLGIIACRKGDVEKGEEYLKQSLKIDEANNDIQGMFLTRSALEKCREKIEQWEDVVGKGVTKSSFPEDWADNLTPIYSKRKRDAPQKPPETIYRERAQEQYEEDQAISSYWSDVVWLLSNSADANDRFMEPLEKLTGQLARNLVVSRAAFGSPSRDKAILRPLEHNERLCTAILVIEKDGLQNEDFRYWMNWCIENVADRDDFRLFVCLDNLKIDDIEKLAREGDKLLATLIDTVQLLESPTAEHLQNNLRTYLRELDDIRREALWRKLRVRSEMILGWIATQIQYFCGAMLGIATLAAFVLGEKTVVNQLAVVNGLFIAIIAGIILFPLLATPLFLLFQGISAANSMIRDTPRIRYWLLTFALFAPVTIGLPQRVGASVSSIALGVVIGVLLDLTRRNGIRAKREYLSLEKVLKVSRIPSLPVVVLKAVKEASFNPIRHPLFPAITPKVFISYTRSSNWSRVYAQEVHRMLCNIGVHSFLDRENIGEGSSWRNQLNRSIANANVFIAVIDEHSVDREWVATEIITALIGKSMTSLPEIIVLMKQELPKLTDPHMLMLPVFRAILQEYGIPYQEGKPRLIAVKDTTLQTVISGLRPNRYSTSSVFPSQLSVLLSFLTIPLVSIGPFGSMVGLPAAIFAYLQYWNKYDSGIILSSWGVLTAIYLLFGYWIGFVGRLTMASWFEVKHSSPSMLTKVHAFSCLGLVGIIAVWSPQVTSLVIGWAFALCYMGWLMSSLFINRVSLEKHDFGRKL